MKIKKFSAFIMSLALVSLFFAGCGADNGSTAANNNNVNTQTQQKQTEAESEPETVTESETQTAAETKPVTETEKAAENTEARETLERAYDILGKKCDSEDMTVRIGGSKFEKNFSMIKGDPIYHLKIKDGETAREYYPVFEKNDSGDYLCYYYYRDIDEIPPVRESVFSFLPDIDSMNFAKASIEKFQDFTFVKIPMTDEIMNICEPHIRYDLESSFSIGVVNSGEDEFGATEFQNIHLRECTYNIEMTSNNKTFDFHVNSSGELEKIILSVNYKISDIKDKNGNEVLDRYDHSKPYIIEDTYSELIIECEKNEDSYYSKMKRTLGREVIDKAKKAEE